MQPFAALKHLTWFTGEFSEAESNKFSIKGSDCKDRKMQGDLYRYVF